MIILLEGPDACGKTSLYNDVFEPHGFKYFHHGVYKTQIDAYFAYTEMLTMFNHNDNIVIDRMHISAAIYGKIMRNQIMQSGQYSYIEGRCCGLGIIVVNAMTSYDTALMTWLGRDEYVNDVDAFKAIYREYAMIAKYTDLPVINYDYQNKTFNREFSVLDLCKEFVKCN